VLPSYATKSYDPGNDAVNDRQQVIQQRERDIHVFIPAQMDLFTGFQDGISPYLYLFLLKHFLPFLYQPTTHLPAWIPYSSTEQNTSTRELIP
jgi:hypothetical protein